MATERRILFASDFLRQAKQLRKKYHRLDSDLTPLFELLHRGETPGDRIPGVDTELVYKVRLKSTDQAKGKRGGYRVVYYLQTRDSVVMLSIYVKNKQADLSSDRIVQMIKEFTDNE